MPYTNTVTVAASYDDALARTLSAITSSSVLAIHGWRSVR